MVKQAICGTRAEDFLIYLGAHGSARFTEIEKALDATPNLVTRRLEELQQEGLVEKRDGVYAITSRGRSVIGAVTQGGDHPLCERFCDPEICLPDVTDLDGALQRRAGSWFHDLLAALPATADGLADAVVCPTGSIDRCLAMAERWEYVRQDGDVYDHDQEGPPTAARARRRPGHRLRVTSAVDGAEHWSRPISRRAP